MLTEKPVFSIIIPVYNTRDYFERCVESILSQKFSRYEIIVIDDGSTDGSEALCDKMAENQENIRVIHQNNSGPGIARNRGITEARGEFIIFCDSDDFWNPEEIDFLGDMYKHIVDNPSVDIIMFNGCYYYGPDTYNDPVVLCFPELEKQYRNGSELLVDILEKTPEYQWYSVFYAIRRSLFLDNNIMFPDYLFCEDSATIYKVILSAGLVSTFNRCVYYYSKERKDSSTMNETVDVLTGIIDISEKSIDDIKGRTLDQNLKVLLLNNFATLYFMVMIRSGRLKRPDLEKLIQYLYEKRYIMEYAISPKQKTVRSIVRLFGFHKTIKMLNIRRFIKEDMSSISRK